MKFMLNSLQSTMVLLSMLIATLLSGCDLYENWRNGEPTINSIDVPEQVQYGETAEFKVSVFDPEDDTLTYLWYVSDGVLKAETDPTVQWIAPVLINEEIVPPKTVTVRISVKDAGEEQISKTASVLVFSKAYEVANALSGEYALVLTQVEGETVQTPGGVMRLTTTTFSRQYEEDLQFFYGTYQLIEPYDDKRGTINWHADEIPIPTTSTYTWDGKLLVIYWADIATTHVYEKKN